MQNKDDTTKILLGALIGGVIGGTAFYLLHSHQKPVLSKIAQAISEMGEVLDESRVETPKEALDEIGKTIPKGDAAISNVLTWVATGIHLWNHFRKGK